VTDLQVLQAYAARAADYTNALGAIEDMHELDRRRISRWAEEISGPVIDAGCGPGHWTYSLIHLTPAELPQILSELARVLRPQGHLLVGFFDGAAAEPLDHAITKAYYWSVDQMSRLLQDAGFEVLDVETRQDPGNRPHAAIAAIAR
jgi:hypothetical protein